mmetsp:Transcript_10904/g.13650  ORF Transcript_10904/g.13650 Transcript_10904/m.13650 type:complete len:94 (-) Transcript_10904:990-1271(-)
MSAQDKPPIVRDLRKGRTTGGIQSKLSEVKPLTPVSAGGRFSRPFHLLTWALTAGVAVSFVALGVDEKDHRGRDHVFSGLQRYYIDRFTRYLY